MKRRMAACFGLCLALVCSELFGANWSMLTPLGQTTYEDNELVTGSGNAEDNGTGIFFFEQEKPDDLGNYDGREQGNVQAVNMMGFWWWSQTLNPATNQPGGLWPKSRIEDMMYVGDYRTRIEGTGSSAESHGHKVIPNDD